MCLFGYIIYWHQVKFKHRGYFSLKPINRIHVTCAWLCVLFQWNCKLLVVIEYLWAFDTWQMNEFAWPWNVNFENWTITTWAKMHQSQSFIEWWKNKISKSCLNLENLLIPNFNLIWKTSFYSNYKLVASLVKVGKHCNFLLHLISSHARSIVVSKSPILLFPIDCLQVIAAFSISKPVINVKKKYSQWTANIILNISI